MAEAVVGRTVRKVETLLLFDCNCLLWLTQHIALIVQKELSESGPGLPCLIKLTADCVFLL